MGGYPTLWKLIFWKFSKENEEKAIMNLCSRKQKFIDKKENGSYFSFQTSNIYILECKLVLLLNSRKNHFFHNFNKRITIYPLIHRNQRYAENSRLPLKVCLICYKGICSNAWIHENVRYGISKC